jgi:hypothetical protein
VQCEQFAQPQAGERRRQEDRGVLLVGRGASQGLDLLRGEDLDVTTMSLRWLLDLGGRVGGQPPDLLGAAEDAVQQDERQRPGSRGLGKGGQPSLDLLRGDRLDGLLPERGLSIERTIDS